MTRIVVIVACGLSLGCTGLPSQIDANKLMIGPVPLIKVEF